jgi:hypothetical protein
MSDLAQLAEDHIRDALCLAADDFPPFAVDSWSDPAIPGQWVVIEDGEGRRSQVEMDTVVTRGLGLVPGFMARQADRLVKAVLDGVRGHIGGGLIVSRPMPEYEGDGLYCTHLEFRGLWLRLVVGHGERGPVAILSALLGKAPVPLAEPVEQVTWLEM